MTARDGGTRAAGHANGRVARGYTPRLKTSFPPRAGGARIERSCSAGRRPARLGLVAVEGGSGRRGPRDRTVPAEPWRSVERRLQQQLASILPVRPAWSKGFPLSERRRAAQKVGAVSILWKNNPEVARAAWAVWVMRCQLCWIRGAYTGWVATGLGAAESLRTGRSGGCAGDSCRAASMGAQ